MMERRAAHFLLLIVLVSVIPGSPVRGQLAVRGDTVYTMAGEPLLDGVVLVRGKVIERVGSAAQVTIPPGYRVVRGSVVTPGLVDAHTVVGLSGIYNIAHDQMQLERSEALQPELRAVDAYNPREDLVAYVRSLGVTTLHTGHAPGALASGGTIIVKSIGGTVEEALVDSIGMVAFTLGESVSRNYNTPGTSAKAAAMLRSELLKARAYQQKERSRDPEKRPSPDLRLDMLSRVLRREVPVLFTAQSATSIMTALRIANEFGFRMVLDGAAEAYLVLDEIKKAGVPVVLHPTMARNYGETRNVSFETASLLHARGIPFALQSGFEGYVPKTRVVLFEAAIAAANGLPRQAALAAITINAARILGQERRLGSLEEGKDADIVLFDGDPLEYASHVCTVVVDGKVVEEKCR